MTPEQKALLRSAQESVQAARLLAGNAFYNVAVSRAYYAMFYVAKALLLQKGLSFSKHVGTIGAFGKEIVQTGEAPPEFHRYLLDAQDSRLKADYNAMERLTDKDAATHIAHAERFLELADRLLGPLPSADD